MHLVRLAEPSSRIGTDLRAALAAAGRGDDVLGGVALLGVRLPGLDLLIDAVLVLPRGVLAVAGVDLPGPAVRLDAPIDGPWLVDGWRWVRPNGSPVGGPLAAAGAVAGRLEAPGAPELPVSAVIAVGPYVRTVVQPDGDAARGLVVMHPTPLGLVRAARSLATAPRPCDVVAAGRLITMLAPQARLDPDDLAAEGFASAPAASTVTRASHGS
jgi:hypothetical protein